MPTAGHWIDRVTAPIAPRWTLKRVRARTIVDMLRRHYEGAGTGRRTSGWNRSGGDANAVIGPASVATRAAARDLVRNNPYAESALGTIVDHTVGWGIVAKPKPKNAAAAKAWAAWAETTACDADGRHDIYGLQKLVMRTVVESGEVLIRRRIRRLEDGFPIPMQIQILDPDFIDSSKDRTLAGGLARIVQGVEYDAIGRRVAYWLFREHPGSLFGSTESVRVPAENIRHIFRPIRPGQVRGLTWFAPVLLRFKDHDDFDDATLMKQKVAACLALVTTDPSGGGAPIGTVDNPGETPEIDSLQPGAIVNLPTGRTVEVVNPPSVREYADYSRTVLRSIATGLGVTYEDLTGDYADMPFSAARMSWLRHWARVDDWRWRIIIPQFCDPVWSWAMEAAAVVNLVGDAPVPVRWTTTPPPMIDPAAEGLAYMRNIRAGIISWSEAVRERGYDPDELLAEIESDLEKFDDRGIVLDVDPRRMTQAGQAQGQPAAPAAEEEPTGGPTPAAGPGAEADDDLEEDDTAADRRARLRPVRFRTGTYGRR